MKGICNWCKKEFVYKYKNRKRKCCSHACSSNRYYHLNKEDCKRRCNSYRKRVIPLNKNKDPKLYKYNMLWKQICCSGKKDKRITKDYIFSLLDKHTHCKCGVKFRYSRKIKHDHIKDNRAISIDRINSRGKYTYGNMVVVCWKCNQIKNRWTLNELETVVKWLSKLKV